MAAALGAGVCEIYTDVEGVFTADPRIEPRARKLDRISFLEMLELSAAGAKVLQLRSVEYARRHHVRLHVRHSHLETEGTWVLEEDEIPMLEQALIRGVALDGEEAKVTLEDVPDRPGVAASIFKAVAAEGISVDMIVQNVSREGRTDVSFTVPRSDLERIDGLLRGTVTDVGALRYSTDDRIAKLSLVGAGMKTSPGIAADMFDALAAEGINIQMISTSSIRISCVIDRDDADRAVRAVHQRFGLDQAVLPDEG
jgi:aspartate kinase